jgi:Zn-dependent protease
MYEPLFSTGLPLNNLDTLLFDLLWVNIFWGLINLLPIFPLDGGQIAQELMIRNNARQGLEKSLQLSIVVAAVMAVFCGMKFGDFFMVFFFGYLAYINYDAIQQLRGRGGFGPW